MIKLAQWQINNQLKSISKKNQILTDIDNEGCATEFVATTKWMTILVVPDNEKYLRWNSGKDNGGDYKRSIVLKVRSDRWKANELGTLSEFPRLTLERGIKHLP